MMEVVTLPIWRTSTCLTLPRHGRTATPINATYTLIWERRLSASRRRQFRAQARLVTAGWHLSGLHRWAVERLRLA
mgnify:CR=1 FL=1